MHRDRVHRAGFTLIELLVALALAGSVALLAHRVFTGVADAAARLATAREAVDRDRNARRLLMQLAASLDVGTPGTSGFRGGRDAVSFTTWTLGEGGWLERRTVALRAADAALIVAGLTDAPLRLIDDVRALELDYLLDPGATEHWVREWVSPVSAPVALRLRVGRGTGDGGRVDTVLLVVGTRG